jgi:hypothetical protein
MNLKPYSLLSRFMRKPVTEANDVAIQGFASGNSGTEFQGGYIVEEPLKELQGKQGAHQFNLMRKGDGNVAMILRAIKLPIRSANWTIQPDDESPEALAQVKLLKHILFDDLGKPWTRFTGEALTFVDFGYSLFEKTFKPVLNHPEFGHYIGIKDLGFRTQKTIEKWGINECGHLQYVEQIVDGDLNKIVEIPVEYLIHFCPDQEGDNFEGTSYLRPCYGSWFRKNLYLKLLAAGIEKYAVPVPILTVPNGKENSPEYENALKVLRAYTSNQTNYITKPAGWDFDIKVTTLDPAKIRESVRDENQEMVNSVLAAFLILGQANSGSYSLGSTLSDFFGTSVQFLGDHICEVMNSKDNGLLSDLVKLNYGSNAKLKCKLKVEGIRDAASASFADVVQKLTQAGVVTIDSDLQKFIREKYKLPVAKPDLAAPAPTPAPEKPGQVLQFAEKKKPNQAQLIRKSAASLREMVEMNLTYFGVAYIERMRKAYQNAGGNDSKLRKIPNETEVPNFADYQDILTSISMLQAAEAVEPLKENFKLASTDEKLEKVKGMIQELNDNIDLYESTKDVQTALKIGYLQRSIRARLAGIRGELSLSRANIASIKSRVETLTTTQIGDLKKKIDLQYQNSVGSTDSERTLFNDLDQTRTAFTSSPVISTGPDILASQNINESILRETEGEPEVESYTFVAVDDEATTDICSELNGRTFSKDDPDLFRYHPPLHHNCRSYMAVNLKSFKGNPEISKGSLELTKGAQGDITLAEQTYEQVFGRKKQLTQGG